MSKERDLYFATVALAQKRNKLRSCKSFFRFYCFNQVKEYINYIILAIDYAPGGTLSDLIKQTSKTKQQLSEEKCRIVMRSLFNGLRHIQTEMDLVHRDLKPSNIVIERLNDLESIKIVDFGLAVSIKSRSELMSTAGTLIYQAPE